MKRINLNALLTLTMLLIRTRNRAVVSYFVRREALETELLMLGATQTDIEDARHFADQIAFSTAKPNYDVAMFCAWLIVPYVKEGKSVKEAIAELTDRVMEFSKRWSETGITTAQAAYAFSLLGKELGSRS
jgi:hypothetical protein